MIRRLLTLAANLVGIGLVLVGWRFTMVDQPEYAEFPRYGRVILVVGVVWLALVYVAGRIGRKSSE